MSLGFFFGNQLFHKWVVGGAIRPLPKDGAETQQSLHIHTQYTTLTVVDSALFESIGSNGFCPN